MHTSSCSDMYQGVLKHKFLGFGELFNIAPLMLLDENGYLGVTYLRSTEWLLNIDTHKSLSALLASSISRSGECRHI